MAPSAMLLKPMHTISPGSLFVTTGGTVHAIEADRRAGLTYYATLISCPEEQGLVNKLETMNLFGLEQTGVFFFEEVRDKGLNQLKELRISACYQMLGLLYNLAAGTKLENQGECSP